MPPDKEGAPPGGSGTPSKNVEFAGFDFPTDTAQAHKKQAARGLIPIGSVAAQIVAGLKFRRQVERLHRLGPRAVAELLAEIGAERSITTIVDQKLATYAELNVGALELAGGDGYWPAPLREVDP